MNKKKRNFLIFILLLFLIGSRPIYNKILHVVYPIKYYEYIEKYSEKYDLDEYLVMAVIKAESNYNHNASSGVASGLMQLTDETAVWISQKIDDSSVIDIENPETNIRYGCFYLNYLISHYDNTDTALAAYNAGPGNVDKWLGDSKTLSYIPFKETREYLVKVKKYRDKYRKIYPEQAAD